MTDPEPGAVGTEAATRRRRRIAVAGHRGDDATARAGVDDRDPGVRATAIAALARLAALDAETLTAGLDDPEPAVRRRAVQVAATWPGDREPAVAPLVDDPNHLVAEAAAWALGERTPPEPGAVDALTRVARTHPEHLVREAAVAALGAVGDPDGLEAVLAALDERATIRRRAVLALAAFDDRRADDALRRCLGDRDRQVRQAAEDLLGPDR